MALTDSVKTPMTRIVFHRLLGTTVFDPQISTAPQSDKINSWCPVSGGDCVPTFIFPFPSWYDNDHQNKPVSPLYMYSVQSRIYKWMCFSNSDPHLNGSFDSESQHPVLLLLTVSSVPTIKSSQDGPVMLRSKTHSEQLWLGRPGYPGVLWSLFRNRRNIFLQAILLLDSPSTVCQSCRMISIIVVKT